ncbi:SRPBCC family protein [Elioraea rosea]|uniref:SRPBCC family protein n=1 Tax=Elioraea rosea TaxID=2492390 RepID=UPI0011828B8B|nr:SRPBCC family protein [Elioraea rosea]
MTETAEIDAYGRLIEPATLTIQRILPGPVDRVWRYLTDGELRSKWLAAGTMELREGAAFTLTWRNDDLSARPSRRPEGFPEEHSMASRIIAVDPPRHLVIAWGESGEVSFSLEPRGARVLLTLVHRRLPDRPTMLKVAAGWHMHLDVLRAVAEGREAEPFWEGWLRLKDEYDARLG